MFFLSLLQVFGISDERGNSNAHYCYKSDIFTFADISFCLLTSQSQVKQSHLLLPFLLLTALPSSPCGHAFPGSAVLQLCGAVSLPVPVTGVSSSAPIPGCVAPALPFLVVSVSACSETSPLHYKEQPEDVCTITATFSKTFLPYHSAGENRVGQCRKSDLRDRSKTSASSSLQHLGLPTLSPITVMGAGFTSHVSKSLQRYLGSCTLASSNPAG